MNDAQNREADLLYGVPAIAAHLQMTQPQVYHLHNKGEIPTFKIGGKVWARRSTLARHFVEQEAKAITARTGSKVAEPVTVPIDGLMANIRALPSNGKEAAHGKRR